MDSGKSSSKRQQRQVSAINGVDCVLMYYLSLKRTILVRQLLWIKLDQLKRMTQTPLLCLMSGDSYKTEWHTGAIKTDVRHRFLLKSGQRTHRRHWPFHTLKWELLATCLPRWVSKNSAFPDHPSANYTLIRNSFTTWRTLFSILSNAPLSCQCMRRKPARTARSRMTFERWRERHRVAHLPCSICCWWTRGTSSPTPLSWLLRVRSYS